jgi:hypothetical protein
LAGLKRRKLALEMLGAAVQKGLNERLGQASGRQEYRGQKRQNDTCDGDNGIGDEECGPASKKSRSNDQRPS